MEIFYLISKDGENVDVIATSLEDAKIKGSAILGGKAEDYKERF